MPAKKVNVFFIKLFGAHPAIDSMLYPATGNSAAAIGSGDRWQRKYPCRKLNRKAFPNVILHRK